MTKEWKQHVRGVINRGCSSTSLKMQALLLAVTYYIDVQYMHYIELCIWLLCRAFSRLPARLSSRLDDTMYGVGRSHTSHACFHKIYWVLCDVILLLLLAFLAFLFKKNKFSVYWKSWKIYWKFIVVIL